jgi:hypothetical protein
MRAQILASTAVLILLAGCESRGVVEPNNEQLANGTLVDQAAAPGSLGNTSVNYAEGPITPGEQGNFQAVEDPKPEQVLQQYAALLEQHRFDDAFGMWGESPAISEEQFEKQFANFGTIDAAVGEVGRIEGAAGSLYNTIQLTLSGTKKDGTPYVVTGPVTLRRVNDVPGSTAEQRRWHIEKMQLAANPEAAEALIKG